jgi:hypothetical protein
MQLVRAGPAQLPVRQASVPDLNSTSRILGTRAAYQFQCNCIGIGTSDLCGVQYQTGHVYMICAGHQQR